MTWSDIDWFKNGGSYAAIPESRHDVVYPWIINRVRSLAPTSVLDYGGGDGSLARRVADPTAIPVVLYEPSPSMRKAAKRNMVGANIRLVSTIRQLKRQKFDVIIFSAVWMTLHTHEECVQNLKWMKGFLRSNGRIVFAITHPCFRDRRFRTYFTDFDLKRYLIEGAPFSVFVTDGHNTAVLHDTHWSLSSLFSQVAEAELRVEEFVELADTPSSDNEFPGLPSWIVGILST